MSPDDLIPGYRMRAAWQLNDPQIEADAIAFWTRLGILPPGVTPEQRASELVAIAYRDDSVVGVQTAAIERVEQVRTSLAMIRGAVDPAHRRQHIALALTLHSRNLLQCWSRENPDAKLGGLGALVGGKELAEPARQPFWPRTRFILAGFVPDGRQLRISWFEDFRVDDY